MKDRPTSLFMHMRRKIHDAYHRIRHGLGWRWGIVMDYVSEAKQSIFLEWARTYVRLPLLSRPRSHTLSAPLIVSLTSYAPRFPTLAFALRSLLRQTVRADRTILWVAHDDFELLPREVLRLQSRGLEIRQVEDQRSYTKILPALDAFPDAFICTADDDVYYWPTWLAELVERTDEDRQVVRFHRAHEMTFDAADDLRPYAEWIFDTKTRGESQRYFPTGVGGILYPPGILRHTVEDRQAAFTLCPFADDVWLFWIGKGNGARYHAVGRNRPLLNWPQSQAQSLWAENQKGRNDMQIRKMIERYGFPNP